MSYVSCGAIARGSIDLSAAGARSTYVPTRSKLRKIHKYMVDAHLKEDQVISLLPASARIGGHAAHFFGSSAWVAISLTGLALSGCQGEEPQVGSQTNWLLDCETSEDCDGLECICGTCTLDCSGSASCGSLESGTCVGAESAGAVALCGGQAAASDFCAVMCDDGPCPSGTSCVAGVCSPDVAPSVSVTIDPEIRFQPLIGFGAGLGSKEELLLSHPDSEALLDALFEHSGFEMIRFKNRFDGSDSSALDAAELIIAAASERLGKSPTLFLYSDTPPVNLKANGSRECVNSDATCTLSRNADGGFDYAGFADYWGTSLAAYLERGISPDYVSIQSNADWLPGSSEAEACRLLPQEGLGTVTLESGETVESEFGGYIEALEAVRGAVDGSFSGTFAAPEVGSSPMVSPYVDVLDPAKYGALAFHLYGEVAIGGSLQYLERIGQITAEQGHPAIQSEMDETGLNTAVLAYHTLVTAGGAAYLQRNFLAEVADTNPPEEEARALIGVAEDTFTLLPPYHALAHFARDTDPGWLRVDATVARVGAAEEGGDLLATAWVSPDDSALTIVVINPTTTPTLIELPVPVGWEDAFATASVTRTVFDGVERSRSLGSFSPSHGVALPGNSIVTIAALTP